MPNMVLNRNHMMSTTTGHMIGFKKGVPVHVPPSLVKEAIGIGAEAVDEKGAQEIKDKFEADAPKGRPEVPVGEVREAKIREVLEDIMARNETSDFTAAGRPKLDSINAELDFKVSKDEVTPLWDELVRKSRAVDE